MTTSQGAVNSPSGLTTLGSTPRRRIAVILLLLVGTYLLIPQLAGIGSTLSLLSQACSTHVLLAILLQAGTALCAACIPQQALLALGSRVSFAQALQVSLAGPVATLLVPPAGVSGLALRVRYFGEMGCKVETILLGYALEMLGHGVAIATWVGLSLIWLTLSGDTAPWWILALVLAVVLLGTAFVVTVLARPRLGDWRYSLLDRLNLLLVRRGYRTLSVEGVQQRIDQVREALRAASPRLRLVLLGTSIARVLLDVLCLQMSLLAFGYPLQLQRTVIGYGFSAVVGYLSSLPGGLVAIEGSLSAILAQQGVPIALGVAASLTYRLFAFWLPRMAGVFAWWNLQRQSDRPLW